MLTLYQREECSACAKVRQFIAQNNLAVNSVSVPKLGSERKELLALDGIKNAEVPTLVDEKQILQGSEAIIEYLATNYQTTNFGEPKYGLTRILNGLSFGDVISATKKALQSQGFGVLTEIDVKNTLKKKIDVDFRNYVILGACNPSLAHQALSAELGIGLFLPCNVVVSEEDDGKIAVSAIDPKQMFKLLENDQIEVVAKEVRTKLTKAISSI